MFFSNLALCPPIYLLFLKFCSNWGTENDANFSYHNGNSEPKGFGKFILRKCLSEIL